jgi:hypothetical protein
LIPTHLTDSTLEMAKQIGLFIIKTGEMPYGASKANTRKAGMIRFPWRALRRFHRRAVWAWQ